MAEIVLTAQTGRTTGSSASRRLRAEGKVPAVLYGPGVDTVPVSVDWRDLRAALTTDKGVNALITLDLGSAGGRRQAIVKELQRHPVRRDVLHIDFFEVDPDKDVVTDVVVALEGEATAVMAEQGVVEQVMNTLTVTGKPDRIPGHITVGDIELPEGVTTDVDPEEPVVTAQLTSAAMLADVEAAEAEAEAASEASSDEGEGESASAEGEAEGG